MRTTSSAESRTPVDRDRGRVHAEIDVGAITRNCRRVQRGLVGSTLGAVVKANGYGHGAVDAARGAIAGGAERLFVSTAREAESLGPQPVPVSIMGAMTASERDLATSIGAEVTVWDARFAETLPSGTRVHLKLDTGMGRLGVRGPEEALDVGAAVERAGGVVVGVMTHLATADDLRDEFFGEQLNRFEKWVLPLKARFPEALLHAANSAATLRDPSTHFDLVRCGVAIYGLDPFHQDAGARDLKPALTLRSWVAATRTLTAGDSVGYGRRFVAAAPTRIATVPIGYGDGWRRALSDNAEVSIRGRRYPLVGTVSMDNITIDIGLESSVEQGDVVTLLGDGIAAEDVARWLGTINYEITTALTARVPRIPY